MLLLDYSDTHPDPVAMKAAGVVAVMRYLSPNPAKNLTPTERDALHAAGLSIGLVWESTASRAGQGYAAGASDAAAADAQADTLSYPAGSPIFYAVDFDAAPAAVLPYFQGVQSVARRPVGVYGSAQVVEGVPVPWKWQTAAWSHGTISPAADLYQRVGGAPFANTDANDIRQPVPLWGPTTTAPQPIPAPTTEDDMAQIIKHPNGTEALVGPGAAFTVLHDTDTTNALIATGQANPGVTALADTLIWDKLVALAKHAGKYTA